MHNIFAGNLPFDAEESALRSWFDANGVFVKSLTLIRDHLSGEFRGFALAEVDEQEVPRCILRCNGQHFSGRKLVVNRVLQPNS